MHDPWYTSPLFVVPAIWILFLSSILWASQPWIHGKGASHDKSGH